MSPLKWSRALFSASGLARRQSRLSQVKPVGPCSPSGTPQHSGAARWRTSSWRRSRPARRLPLHGTVPSQPRRWGMASKARVSAARLAVSRCGRTPGSIRGIGTRILRCVWVRDQGLGGFTNKGIRIPDLIRGIGARSLLCGWDKIMVRAALPAATSGAVFLLRAHESRAGA